jgi:hypothetical protein
MNNKQLISKVESRQKELEIVSQVQGTMSSEKQGLDLEDIKNF